MKLPKVYEPNQYESDIYLLWEKSEAFVPKHRGSKENFSMVMPPPNANGQLHIGHALMLAIQDVVVRYQRMQGKAVLWVPGADHAGFETQVVYEKELAKTGKSRFDFTREQLFDQVWDFVAQNRGEFETQFRRIGASPDWQHHTYTLDDKIVSRAYATFKKMWDDGLIYRGERLVNFCTHHGTGFADIEVEHKQVAGHLWHIKYPLTDGSGEVIVATTRPETMLGDTAVAVHPDDERYKHFIGKTVKLPLTAREIPVIADEFVDTSFGTGAVKITPAHDPNDYEAGQRHDLPMVTVIDHSGRIAHTAPKVYQGMTVEEARQAIVTDLTDLGLIDKIDDHTHNVGHCYKCDTVIQPLLREQWFIDMKPLATEAIKALRADRITFHPESKKEQLITYLKGLRDWNISRQIAWGIPIPAFQSIEDPEQWIFDERIDQETIEVSGKMYRRDPDVFDTWFSSSSWPYATLDYPDGDDFKQFYPTNLMETGGEILYPWVSRMIMLGLYVTGEVPFKDVYIHGYVLAEDGAKMSKSIGNVINPITVIDQYGADALRLGILAGRTAAVNRGYDSRRVIESRNFCNKLWNIARYVEDKVGEDFSFRHKPQPELSADYWVLGKLQQLSDQMSAYIEEYRLSEAYEALYHFVWDDFADWYIEASKSHVNKSMLAFCLEAILKIAHPFAPFVTETIWQTLAWEGESLLATSAWPQIKGGNAKKGEAFEEIKGIVSEIRYVRTVAHLQSGLQLYHAHDEFIAEHAPLIKALGNLEGVKEVRDGHGLHLTSTERVCWLDIDRETANHLLWEIAAKKEQQQVTITRLEQRLANKTYVDNAPKKVVEETKAQLADAQSLLNKLDEEYNRFADATH